MAKRKSSVRLVDKLRVTDIGITTGGKLLTLRHGQELRVVFKTTKNAVTGYLMNMHADGWQLEYLTLQTGVGMRLLVFGKDIEDIAIIS